MPDRGPSRLPVLPPRGPLLEVASTTVKTTAKCRLQRRRDRAFSECSNAKPCQAQADAAASADLPQFVTAFDLYRAFDSDGPWRWRVCRVVTWYFATDLLRQDDS